MKTMGFFDKLGVGGGSLEVVTATKVVAVGDEVHGTVTFKAGKRKQKITALLVWLARGKSQNINLAKGEVEERDGSTSPLGAKLTVSEAFEAAPGESYAFDFAVPVPAKIMNSRAFEVNGEAGPVVQWYHVHGTADIPGEIDKHGDSSDFEVTGGMSVQVTTS
jgi:sporulation-control protein spo0M